MRLPYDPKRGRRQVFRAARLITRFLAPIRSCPTEAGGGPNRFEATPIGRRPRPPFATAPHAPSIRGERHRYDRGKSSVPSGVNVQGTCPGFIGTEGNATRPRARCGPDPRTNPAHDTQATHRNQVQQPERRCIKVVDTLRRRFAAGFLAGRRVLAANADPMDGTNEEIRA